jgi:hypothetical protein
VQRKCSDRDLKLSKVTESVNIKEVRKLPIPVISRAKALVCGRSLVGIVGSNPAAWKSASSECCLLSGRGLCDWLVTRPEESYRVWCVR